jgi:SEC-C motif
VAETPTVRPGRNEPCRCGSGKKYKHCCLEKDEAAERAARARQEEDAPPPAPEAAPRRRTAAPRAATTQPWKRGARNTKGFQKFSGPRKVGSG